MRNDHTCSALRTANRPGPRGKTLPLVTLRSSPNLPTLCRLALLAGLLAMSIAVGAAGETSISPEAAIGHVDTPAEGVISTAATVISGWSLSKLGIARIEIVIDGRERIAANLGVERSDVMAAHPDYPDNVKAGFDAKLDLSH